MNAKQALTSILTFSILLPMSIALADHQGGGGDPVSVLTTEARELDALVRYSSLRWDVKSSVSAFAMEASRLQSVCSGRPSFSLLPFAGDFNSGSEPLDHDGGGGVNPACEFQLSRVSSAFSPVERHLSDTYYDYREIYQQYVQVRDALRVAQSSIHTPIDPPPFERQVSLTCQSIEFQQTNCNVGGMIITGAEVQYQMSHKPCIFGSSWGITGDRTAIWVTGGCRASFLVRGR